MEKQMKKNEGGWKVHCLFDKLVSPGELKFHPDNSNDHPEEQIPRLADILAYQGWRYAIKISKRSGFITSGHGRLMAAVHGKQKTVPVVYQDYESEDQEIADVNADNAIAAWATLNLSKVNQSIEKLGPDFNVDMLGIKNFKIDVSEKDMMDGADELNPDKIMTEFIVAIYCKNEEEQQKVFSEMFERGLDCKLIS